MQWTENVFLEDCIPDETDMAIRNEDWDAIHRAINEAIEAAVTRLQPHGWRKAVFFLREWGILATNFTIIVALAGIAAAAFYHATARVEKEARFETDTGRDIKEIRKDIQNINDNLARKAVERDAALSPSDFKASLPEVKNDLAAALKSGVKVMPKTIDNLRKKLLVAGQAEAGFWPATAEFISYRSHVSVSDSGNLLRANLPNCRDHVPEGVKVTSVKPDSTSNPDGPGTITLANIQFSDCRITLDSLEDDEVINSVLLHKSPQINFTHCLVLYNGGSVNLITEFNDNRRVLKTIEPHGKSKVLKHFSVSGKTLLFNNCLFSFSLPDTPLPVVRKVTESLLAQSGNTYSISISSTTS